MFKEQAMETLILIAALSISMVMPDWRQLEFPAFSGLILTMRAWLRISKCGG